MKYQNERDEIGKFVLCCVVLCCVVLCCVVLCCVVFFFWQVGTKEYGKMLKRIQVVEDGGVPAKEARSCRIEGQKRRIARKEYQRL